MIATGTPERSGNKQQNETRDTHQDNASQHDVALGENAKGRARILGMDNAQQAVYYTHVVAKAECMADRDFRYAIREYDQRDNAERPQHSRPGIVIGHYDKYCGTTAAQEAHEV